MTGTPSHALPTVGQNYCPTCERMYPEGEHCPEDGSRLVKIKAVVDPLLGRVLDGRYTIIEKLGQGGMGAVYRASQHSVGREVAIKLVNPHLVSDPDAIRRFLREAKIASSLAHPNAVAVLDFGQSDDGLFYLVMELVTGRTLDQVIRSERTFRPERIVRIGAQVCDALEGAHALQIVHRDLKPANIMLLAQGRDLVKVLDFGLAKSVATDQAVTTMTNAGALLGTPAYMPPELALGQPCDARADLYALGCVLYLLGSGRLPFVSDSAHELVAAHAHDRAPPMTGVPAPLAAVIDRLLEKDPNLRFQTAAETREALEATLEGRFTPLPFKEDTDPSLGPFPAGPGRYANLRDTPTPRRMSTQEAQLASSDTIASPLANGLTIREDTPRRRWVVPVLVGFALLGAGLGALVVTRAGRGNDEPAASAPAETAPDQPSVAPPAVAAPAPNQSETPPATGSASTQPAVATPDDPPPDAAVETADTSPKPHKVSKTVKTTTSTKQTKTTTKTTTKITKPPPPPPGNSGGALPF